MKKIAYIEDSFEARESAKKAAEAAGLTGFVVVYESASEAYSDIINGRLEADFILCDLMFKEDPTGEIKDAYEKFVSNVEELAQSRSVNFTHRAPVGEHGSTEEEIYRLRNGKVSRIFLERCVSGQEKAFFFPGTPQEMLAGYEDLPREYALGAVIMAEVWRKGMQGSIFSSSHRHDIFIQAGGLVLFSIRLEFPDFFLPDSGTSYEIRPYLRDPSDDNSDIMPTRNSKELSPYTLDAEKTEEAFLNIFQGLQKPLELYGKLPLWKRC